MPDTTSDLAERIIREFEGTELDPATGSGGAWEVIVKYNGDILGLGAALGVDVEVLSETYAIITLRREQISQLYDFPEIEYIELPRTLFLNLQESLSSTCIPQVQDPNNYGLRGKDTIVAVIDSGIDYTHPDFRNDDGTTRILYIWDQTAQGQPPPGFSSGAQYDTAQINAALAAPQPFDVIPQVDMVGHGTAVAGIAAGNGRAGSGREVGAAPEAGIIAVKLGQRGRESFARTTELMRAAKYVVDRAQELQMPVAVNISYGTNNGSHDGNSLFETFLDEMALRWKNIFVVASGNEGAAGHHFSATLNTGELMAVEFSTVAELTSFYLAVWKNFVDSFSFELVSPSGTSSGEIVQNRPGTLVHMDGTVVYITYGQPSHYNVSQELFFQFQRGDGGAIPAGIWRINVRGLEVVDGRFNMWLPTTEDVTDRTAFTRPTTNTTLTLPSTASRVISVGGYNSMLGSAPSFSGRGFTRDDTAVKPDLVAPAVDIVSARMGGGYSTYTGTSMAAPFVTGAAALMMEWGIVKNHDPFLYGQRAKAFLRRGASRTQGREYPNTIWGYGRLCLLETMRLLQYYNAYGPGGMR